MNTRLPAAVRATAAVACRVHDHCDTQWHAVGGRTQASELIAQSTARQVAEAAAARRATLLAQASAGQRER